MVKKLNWQKVSQKLKELSLAMFTPAEFAAIFKVSRATAAIYIHRNLANGFFTKLRNNYYIFGDEISASVVANKLYQPSYISLETALARYGIIPESVYATTSITTKPTRDFITPQGEYVYQRLKQSAFTGYNAILENGQTILLADPEKSLADYLYFVCLKKTTLNDRLDLTKINKSALLRYARLFNYRPLITLINQVYAQSQKHQPIY